MHSSSSSTCFTTGLLWLIDTLHDDKLHSMKMTRKGLILSVGHTKTAQALADAPKKMRQNNCIRIKIKPGAPRQDEARQLAPSAANSSQGSSARIYHKEGKLGITVLPRKSSKREPASNPSHLVTGIKRFVCRELTSASSSSLLSSWIVRRTLLDDMVDSSFRRVHTGTHKRHTKR